jgi:hypothetical protein
MTSFFRKAGSKSESRVTELEQIFAITTEEAEQKIYKLGAPYDACEAYNAAASTAFQALENKFEVVFQQTDVLSLESEDLKFALLDERARSLTRNQKYFCDLFGTAVDALATTFAAKQLREILVNFLNNATKYHIDHVNEDIGTVERLVSLAVRQLVWSCERAFPSDDPNGAVWEAIRAHSLFEKVFPMRFRKEVRFGSVGFSELSDRVFLVHTKRQSLPSELGMPGYNVPYWTKQSGEEAEKKLAALAEALAISILARSANQGLPGPESQIRAARSLLCIIPDWFLKELLPATKFDALERWLADTRDLASASAPEPKSIEDRIEAIEILLGLEESSSQSDTAKLLAFAERLLRSLAEDDSSMSFSETTWRDFWFLYCELLWDRGADEGIRVGLALSTDDVDHEIFKYERWKRLLILRKLDSVLRAVGR